MRNTRNISVLVAFVTLGAMVCLLTTPVLGETYYVTTTGNNTATGSSETDAWRTITYAAAQAQAGDTIKIKGGNYGHEHVVIQNSGTATNRIAFEGYSGTPLINGAGGGGYGIDIQSKSHISVSGLAITGYQMGILSRSGSGNIALDNITAYQNALSAGGYGILFEGAGNSNTISNCTAYNNDMGNYSIRGTVSSPTANCLIENCKSYNIEGLGTYADYDYAISDGANNNTIKNCTAGGYAADGYHSSGHGYAFRRGATNNTVIGCTSIYSQCEHYASKEDSEYNEFINCTAEGQRDEYNVSGVNISASHNKVVNCTVSDVKYGMRVFYSSAEPSTNLPVRDNLFKNNIVVGNQYGFSRSTTNTDPMINEYNNVWGNTSYNYSNCLPGTGDISVDPLFADMANGDFHLKSEYGRWEDGVGWVLDGESSPCIDTGNPGDDYSNEPWCNGDRINMGAYGNTLYASKTVPEPNVTAAVLLVGLFLRRRRRRLKI